MRDREGFTLIEVMIVGAIVALLAGGIAVFSYVRSVEKAQTEICGKNRSLIAQAEQVYVLEKGVHSASIHDLVDDGYLKSYPTCPAGGVYAWATDTQDGQSVIVCSVHGVSLPEEGSGVLGDDFDGGAGDWTEMSRWWEVRDGKYYGGQEDGWGGENRAFFGDEDWTDYTIELDADLLGGGPTAFGYGVYFRSQDFASLDSYVFQYDPGWGEGGSFLFREIVNGWEQPPLAVAAAPAGYDWTDSEKHITIEVSGSTFTAYVSDVDGGTTPVLTASDDSYTQGAIGLRTWNNSYASFDNVEVREQ